MADAGKRAKYQRPRITPVSSILDQAFGTTCGPGSQAGGGDICFAGSAADPGVCTDGNQAYQGLCSTGSQALGGQGCRVGNNTNRCANGPSAFIRCTVGSSTWMLTTEPVD